MYLHRQGLVPVAFAVWNGGAWERNGLKRLSAWHAPRFEKTKTNRSYARELADPPPKGNAINGKRLMVEQSRAGCHAFPAIRSDLPLVPLLSSCSP
jgi:complex iron-sulfur molybdoenzyme family reductase subunit gamma